MAGFKWDGGQSWDGGWFWDQPLGVAPPFYPGSIASHASHESSIDVEAALLVRNRDAVLQFVQFICATDLLDS